MANVAAVVEVARPLNDYLRQLYDDHVGLPPAGLELVGRSVDAIAEVVQALEEGRGPGAPDTALADQIRALHQDYELRAEAGAVDTILEQPEFDFEILGIFVEEAAEILEEAQDAMAAWRANPRDGESLRALQRYLHTIKGSSRLAGVSTIGDFSHALENLFEGLAEGRREAEPGLVDRVQRCLDALHGMRDVAAQGRMPEAPADLLAQLEAPSAAPAAPEVPAVPEPEAAPEAEVEAEAEAEAEPEAEAEAAPEPEAEPEPSPKPSPSLSPRRNPNPNPNPRRSPNPNSCRCPKHIRPSRRMSRRRSRPARCRARNWRAWTPRCWRSCSTTPARWASTAAAWRTSSARCSSTSRS